MNSAHLPPKMGGEGAECNTELTGLTGMILRHLSSKLDTVMNHELKDVIEGRLGRVEAIVSLLNLWLLLPLLRRKHFPIDSADNVFSIFDPLVD